MDVFVKFFILEHWLGQINPLCVLHGAQRPAVFTFPSKSWETGVLGCLPFSIHGLPVEFEWETNNLNRICKIESKPTLDRFTFSSSMKNIVALHFSSLNHVYLPLTKAGDQGWTLEIRFHLGYCLLLLIGPKLDTEFPLSHLYLTMRFLVLIQAFVASFYLIICQSDTLDVFL